MYLEIIFAKICFVNFESNRLSLSHVNVWHRTDLWGVNKIWCEYHFRMTTLTAKHTDLPGLFCNFWNSIKWVTLITEHLYLREELTLKSHLKLMFLLCDVVTTDGTLVKAAFLQDTEAVSVLKLSSIIKEGRSSGSWRFSVENDRQGKSRRGKREKQTTEGHRDRGEGKTSSKRGKKIYKV